MTNTPSEEDFARAERLDRERSQGLEEVNQSVDARFKSQGPLHYFFLMPQQHGLRAYVFFETEADIQRCENNGFTQEIVDFVHTELERVGRGSRDQIRLAFEFDSDEAVKANFKGDYFLRLR